MTLMTKLEEKEKVSEREEREEEEEKEDTIRVMFFQQTKYNMGQCIYGGWSSSESG